MKYEDQYKDCRNCSIQQELKKYCGKRVVKRGSSQSVTITKVPDERCRYRRKK